MFIQHAVWLCFRFALSLRDVDDMLAECGIDAFYETVRRWALKYGRICAKRIRRRRPRPSDRWHLNEVFLKIGGKTVYLRRAIDDEGEVLDILVQSKRDRRAALNLLRKLLKRQVYVPDSIVTDRLRPYRAALRDLALADRHVTGGRSNKRAEVSRQPTRRRERQQLRFESRGSAQRFLASQAAMANHFNVQRHLNSRRTLKILRAEALADCHEILAA